MQKKAGVAFKATLFNVKVPDPLEVMMALSPPSASIFTLSLLVIYAPITLYPSKKAVLPLDSTAVICGVPESTFTITYTST